MAANLSVHEMKLLIKHGTLLPILEDQMTKLGSILERDAPPNCYQLETYSIHLQQYSYLCRKVRQLRRIKERMITQ